MTTISTGECLTNTQIAGRELQQRYLDKQNPQSTVAQGAVGQSSALQNTDGSAANVQPGNNRQSYGSPASKYLDITV